MKLKTVGILLFATLLLWSCVNSDLPDVNGMWQLKSVESAAGTQTVDTIYYSFNSKEVFAYTLLHQYPDKPDASSILYGYVTFPDDKTMAIEMDSMYDNTNFDSFPRLEKNITYGILHLSSKKMTLSYNNETYNFVKF